MVQLMSLQNRRERIHREEVAELKGRLELVVRASEVREQELTAENERVKTLLKAKASKVERLKTRVEELQSDLADSDKEVTRQRAELDLRTRDLAESQDKLGGMGAMCRRRMKLALKAQLSKFKTSCREQSHNAVKAVQGYMKARGGWERADKLLSQAKGTLQLLEELRKGGVAIPDSALALIKEEEVKYTKERDVLSVEGLSSEDFEFVLPSNLGIPNLDQMDFSEGALLCSGEGGENPQESVDEEDADDEETEASDGEGGDMPDEEARDGISPSHGTGLVQEAVMGSDSRSEMDVDLAASGAVGEVPRLTNSGSVRAAGDAIVQISPNSVISSEGMALAPEAPIMPVDEAMRDMNTSEGVGGVGLVTQVDAELGPEAGEAGRGESRVPPTASRTDGEGL